MELGGTSSVREELHCAPNCNLWQEVAVSTHKGHKIRISKFSGKKPKRTFCTTKTKKTEFDFFLKKKQNKKINFYTVTCGGMRNFVVLDKPVFCTEPGSPQTFLAKRQPVGVFCISPHTSEGRLGFSGYPLQPRIQDFGQAGGPAEF